MEKDELLLRDLPPDPIPEKVVDALEEAFVRHVGNEEYLAGMKMVVPGAGKLYGVKVPFLRKMAIEVVSAYKTDNDDLWAIALTCWGQGSREHQLVALFILAKLKLKPAERWHLGERFLPDVGNWESCDQLCMALLGQALAEDHGYMDVIEGWAGSENLWVRRAALVAPVYLRRGKHSENVATDLDRRTLAICEALLDDQENYIRKAVDWSVREVIKRHYDLGREWLMAQAGAAPSRTARTTLKQAAKKLTEADRTAFLTVLEG
ncbi:MAG TPA: DNA alkylation repair protein [Anaerolineae bacterium]|nr:DNA alkylation repair protein [Anaerolineae bacterium]